MNKLGYKLVSGAAGAALFMATFASSAFAEELKIVDNGAGSNNTITVTNTNICTVTQENKTKVEAIVVAGASTGGNTASSNTGGDVTIDTGNATATATMTVTGGDNTATDPCCCDQAVPPANQTIKDNGVNTDNIITSTNTNISTLSQKSKTKVRALVGAKAKTGKNKAKYNTGGSTEVKTGNSDATADLSVTGGSNNLP